MEIEILDEDRLRYWCGRIDIPEPVVEIMARMARDTCAEPRLLGVFRRFYQESVLESRWHDDWDTPVPFDPEVIERYGQGQASMFYLLAYLSALPAAERMYRERSIGMDIFHDTFLDVRIWLLRAFEEFQEWRFNELMWITLHLTGRLYRLGRLQFALREYDEHATAFRHKTSGKIQLLCGPQIALREDGYALGAGRWDESQPIEGQGWHAVFEETADGWLGNRIVPLGYALREPVFLPRDEWEIALRQGDTVLDFHIPRGGKMSAAECRESVRRGYAFFEQHDPERPIKAGFCHTWFFTPQLQQILPAESNLVRFQREFYLLPGRGSPRFLWDYVFGRWVKDLGTAPRDTALRQAVLEWLERGGELFDLPGLMFHTADQWGTQPYYTGWENEMKKREIDAK